MSQHRKRLRDPRQYTLTELEELDWGPPTFNSWLVQTAHRLRKVPLKDLGAGDLRLLIGQRIGLPYLVPVALDLLATDPLIEGSYDPGDLLNAIIGIPPDFWVTYSKMASHALAIARAALDAIDASEVEQDLKAELQHFIEVRNA